MRQVRVMLASHIGRRSSHAFPVATHPGLTPDCQKPPLNPGKQALPTICSRVAIGVWGPEVSCANPCINLLHAWCLIAPNRVCKSRLAVFHSDIDRDSTAMIDKDDKPRHFFGHVKATEHFLCDRWKAAVRECVGDHPDRPQRPASWVAMERVRPRSSG